MFLETESLALKRIVQPTTETNETIAVAEKTTMIFLILFILNILLIFFLRIENKYWLVTLTIWAVLIVSFILWRRQHDHNIEKNYAAYWNSTENKSRGEDKILEELEREKKMFKNII